MRRRSPCATAPHGADRNADDDEIGVLDRCGIGLDHLIGEAELRHALARCRRARGGDDRPRRARARAPRARSSRRSGRADQREPVERWARLSVTHGCAHLPRNSASVFTTSRLASSVPTVMRKRIRQLVGRDRAQDERRARSGRRRPRFAVLPWLSGKWISTKLRDARRHREAELADLLGQPGAAISSLCARELLDMGGVVRARQCRPRSPAR